MRLADSEITITVGGEAIHLRPTLRAAFRLERRYGGFNKIMKAIMDGSVTVIADVIAESTDRFAGVSGVVARIGSQPASAMLEGLTVPLVNHVFALAGVDGDGKQEDGASGKRITFAEFHTRLYRIATGHLGWPPEVAWNATAAEIIEASRGRNEMITDLLKAVFGGGTTESQSDTDPMTLDRDGLAALRASL